MTFLVQLCAPRVFLSLDMSRVLHSGLGCRRTAIGWLEALNETTQLTRLVIHKRSITENRTEMSGVL